MERAPYRRADNPSFSSRVRHAIRTRYYSRRTEKAYVLLFLYREVLRLELPWLDDLVRAKRPEHLPVLTRDEVRRVIDRVDGVPRLTTNQITIRGGKGVKDRLTMFPGVVKGDLAKHFERVRALHQRDLRHGAGWVELPWALAREYPNAGRQWTWQWVFPATRFYVDRDTG